MLLYLLRHPDTLMHFAADVYDDIGKNLDRIRFHARTVDVRAQRLARKGQWMFPFAAEKQCARQLAPAMYPPWPGSVDAFQQKYSAPSTTVLIDVAPTPVCDTAFGVFERQIAGMHDNSFERLPIRFFNDSDVHFDPEGSRYVSEEVARQILDKMRQQSNSPS